MVFLLTGQSDIHLGGVIVQEHVVQSGNGVEEHGVHLGGEQADQIGDTTTAVDHLKALPVWG